MKSVELFAGAGGLSLGLEAAGFKHAAVLEWNRDACETLRLNRGDAWPVHEGDVRSFNYASIQHDIDLLAGGPPCQPFSLGGKHRAQLDERDMFPQAVRAVRELRPRAFMFENVKGLLRQTFSSYFSYILLMLEYPSAEIKQGEDWLTHLARLEKMRTRGAPPEYNVIFRLLNAADYGVPQKRERVFIVGFRSDQGVSWSFPEPTHSLDALLWDQWITGEYWKRHHIQAPNAIKKALAPRVRRLESMLFPPQGQPWRTVRDALGDMPDPRHPNATSIEGHAFNPGARAYPGHTGSPIDEPAKTLKAGDHGVPGGENMLAMPNGEVRYFSVRESARLQTFPDDYRLTGSWSEAMRQLGNAVPAKLAEIIARDIQRSLAPISRGH